MAETTHSKPKSTRGRRSTKVEEQADFEQILQAHIDAKASQNSKIDKHVKIQEDEILEEVKDLSAEEVIRKVANFTIDTSKTLSAISEKLVSEIELLAKVRQAVDLEKRELEQLHKIDVAQTALDTLLDEFTTQKDQFEAEITTIRDSWEAEQLQHEAELKEYEESLAKTRKRESEEFEYKRTLERKKTNDKYEEEIRLKDRQNKENQEALEKGWQAREATIKAQEEEFKALKESVEGFPNRLQLEIQRAVQEAEKRVEQRLSQELLLLKRDTEAERKIAELKIHTLQEAITQATAQNNKLQVQLDEAKNQVQEIAIKAIEGASGAKTLSHVNQIAMEQAKGRVNPGQ